MKVVGITDTCCIDDDGTDEDLIIVTRGKLYVIYILILADIPVKIRFVCDFTTTVLRHSGILYFKYV